MYNFHFILNNTVKVFTVLTSKIQITSIYRTNYYVNVSIMLYLVLNLVRSTLLQQNDHYREVVIPDKVYNITWDMKLQNEKFAGKRPKFGCFRFGLSRQLEDTFPGLYGNANFVVKPLHCI